MGSWIATWEMRRRFRHFQTIALDAFFSGWILYRSNTLGN